MTDTLIFIAQFIIGLVFIVKGADWMTDGAAAIAKRYGISTLVIGMTIIAIGSSAPEFVVSTLAAIKGNTDMAIGNVVGSNIFNILTIMGVTALFVPVAATNGNLRNDVPFAVLSSLAVLFAAYDGIFTPGATSEISRQEGLLLLCLFAVFLSYTFAIAKKPAEGEEADAPKQNVVRSMSLTKSIIWVVGGLALLIFGGDWLVDGASGIATKLGVSQAIIALTIVSAGTSAPELAASVMAARKGDTAMALGNIVGSVVFNVFFVLGTAATIHPLALGNITDGNIVALVGASVLLWIFCRTHKTLVKWEGAFLLILQIVYFAYLIAKEQSLL